MRRIALYDISHNPDKAWNTFSDEITALQSDLSIIQGSYSALGEIPNDIRKRLLVLSEQIQFAVNRQYVEAVRLPFLFQTSKV